MSGWLVASLVVLVAGAWLAVTGLTRLRPDPLTWALSGHPLQDAQPHPTLTAWIDRGLSAWDERLGGRGRESSLAVLRRTTAAHRRRQVHAAAVAAAIAVLLLVMSGGPSAAWLWAAALVPAALAAVDWQLRRSAARRREDLGQQVTVLSEYLALCATAGLTAAEAFEHASRHTSGPLQEWLAAIVADVRSGRSLAVSLQEAATAMAVAEFTRLTDTVLTAVGQGTPLAATLVAQAQDSRSSAHARLLERAGRAEVAMLVPIVGLVLPAVVAVAVYPGLTTLMSM